MVKNKMTTNVPRDSMGFTGVVDEAHDGTKAIPIVLVTKDGNGNFEYANGGGGGAGVDGKSAFEIAVDNGFAGDEAAWIASLKGTPGTNGTDGKDGFGTQAQYDAIIARLDALETT